MSNQMNPPHKLNCSPALFRTREAARLTACLVMLSVPPTTADRPIESAWTTPSGLVWASEALDYLDAFPLRRARSEITISRSMMAASSTRSSSLPCRTFSKGEADVSWPI